MTQPASFHRRLSQRWQQTRSLVCVGLDPDPARLPAGLPHTADGILKFLTAIVDATAGSVCAFKPQIAHFAALGAEQVLEQLIAHIHRNHPDVLVFLDAKRGDIGSTADHYAIEAFERYEADAVTVNPYLGSESITPFLRRADGQRGVIVLCRTSNPDSDWLQNYPTSDPVYLRVAAKARTWNEAGNVMLVAGATYPEEIGRIRQIVDDMPLLVPGIGAQGGDLEAVLKNGLAADGMGLCINSSRAIIYASADKDFAQAAASEAIRLRDAINRLRNR